MTGMMAQTGSLGQPLLIPLSMAGSIAGQGGLAVLTLPTTNVASLPAIAAASAAGNLLKLPFAGLQGTSLTASLQTAFIGQLANTFKKIVSVSWVNRFLCSAATVLNSVQPQLHANTQTMFQHQTASIQPVQSAVQQVTSQPTQTATPQVTTAHIAAAQQTPGTTTVSQSNISVAALQAAGLSINPAIVSVRISERSWFLCSLQCESLWFYVQINAASLGAQPQFLSSLTSTPFITSAMSNVAGITSQIITNAQGQVGAARCSTQFQKSIIYPRRAD